jgi:hypothetical protein
MKNKRRTKDKKEKVKDKPLTDHCQYSYHHPTLTQPVSLICKTKATKA